MKPENLAAIREKYGIDIKMVETKNADGSRAVAGIQDRTFEISLIDKDGNIIEDAEGKYAHIIGNGTTAEARSNAYTIDWNGNAWHAGTVEGTAMILSSPNGTRFQITVSDNGTLSATQIVE